MSQIAEIKVPDIGSDNEVDVIDVAVKVGDVVAANDTLITLESEKATMDVPSDKSGKITEILVKAGDKVAQGRVIVKLETTEQIAATPNTSTKQAAVLPDNERFAFNLIDDTSTKQVAVPPPAAAVGVLAEIKVPDIGGEKAVDVIDVAVKVGDVVAVNDTLITLESEKATMDVPADKGGKITEVLVKAGDKVIEGNVIVRLISSAAAAKSDVKSEQSVPPSAVVSALPQSASTVLAKPTIASAAAVVPAVPQGQAHAGPAVRKLARELGVDLRLVKGSARQGRVVADDVKNYVKNALQQRESAPSSLGGGLDLLPWPKVDFAKFGEIEVKPLSRIKKISGQNLARNWVMIPHVTHQAEADMTDLESFRRQLNKEWERDGLKISALAFIIKASVKALQEFPDFNASLDGDNLILKKYCHIGFAADTPNGLVVPVIKDADKKGLKEMTQELTNLSKKAREGKLMPQEMQGACFTVSSLGGIGGTGFSPIINAPEVAILGVCQSQMKPVWNGNEFTPRLMCPLSLSFDHRVIDGASGMRFLVYLADLLADFRRVLL
ncbi:dihydrolipoyllysine-residue acetyltransferase [Stenoxybacter acetivorans]|uniref:dihydrolipoyllysine-residue acetyltransferase n=1 Tax=Stenoxybacter acetivorans TaxID=422441 RepID=UPI00055E570C|nr:dihydrolipoyllysine-residue acetyltransferase [Stenoxybacter acetivorans]